MQCCKKHFCFLPLFPRVRIFLDRQTERHTDRQHALVDLFLLFSSTGISTATRYVPSAYLHTLTFLFRLKQPFRVRFAITTITTLINQQSTIDMVPILLLDIWCGWANCQAVEWIKVRLIRSFHQFFPISENAQTPTIFTSPSITAITFFTTNEEKHPYFTWLQLIRITI